MLNKVWNRFRVMLLRFHGAKIADKCSVHKYTEISHPAHIEMKSNAVLYKNVSVLLSMNGKFSLGSQSHAAPFVYFLIGNNSLIIGDDVAIGPFCAFYCQSNDYKNASLNFNQQYSNDNIRVGNNVFIGSHSVILGGSIIEDNVVVAAGSVVKGTLESGFLYGGNPAEKIKKVSS